jgi:hypothetical protein
MQASRVDLWWLLASIREIFDMQANRRKTTWFNMQKLVVNNYALGILVLKVTTTSIASRSHTMTDPQPNEIRFDKPTKPNQTHLRFQLIM